MVASGNLADAQQTAGGKQLSGGAKHHIVTGGLAACKRQASSKENNGTSTTTCSLPQNLHGGGSGFMVDMKFNKTTTANSTSGATFSSGGPAAHATKAGLKGMANRNQPFHSSTANSNRLLHHHLQSGSSLGGTGTHHHHLHQKSSGNIESLASKHHKGQ